MKHAYGDKNIISKNMIRLGKYILLIICAGIFFIAPLSVLGAETTFYFESTTQEIKPGSEISVSLKVDSLYSLNAYDVVVYFPKDIFELLLFDNSKSLIDVWQNQPVMHDDGSVRILGGSLRGFEGYGGELITFRVRALQEGTATFDFKSIHAYLANGKGTLADATSRALSFVVSESAELVMSEAIEDIQPPEIQYLALEDNPINEDQKLLNFFVRDQESGVKEVSARSLRGIALGPWKPIQNPTAFRSSVWAVKFQVIDNTGNIRNATLYNPQAIMFDLSFVVAFIIVICVGIFMYRSRNKIIKKLYNNSI